MSFEQLKKEVEKGLDGNNNSIPMGFNRLNKHIGIRKSIFTLVGGNTGCLSGDTLIYINRGNRPGSRDYTLKDLYYKFQGKKILRNKNDKRNGHFWDLSFPTKTLSYNHNTKFVELNTIVNVVESGIKKVFLLKTESGKEIKATKDHKFLVDSEDTYKTLEELSVGDNIYIKSTALPKGRRKRPYRKEFITKMPYYPSSTNKIVDYKGTKHIYQRIKHTRAVYDASLNNVSLKEFLINVKTNPNHNYVFSDMSKDIHHLDENPHNDVPENLLLLTTEEHNRLHGYTLGLSNFGNRSIISDKIVSITLHGEEMTYDIEMTSPYNNFLANGIFVHNSGKTSFIDDAYVLNPFDWYMSRENTTNIKLKIIYRSMERNSTYKLAKWVSRKIFLDQGIIISVNKLLGWTEKMNKDEHDIFLMYEDYVNSMKDVITILDGPENPVGIAKELKAHAIQNGKIEQLDEYNKKYIPNNDNEITIVVIDHIGLLKTTKDQPTKKEAIDKMSDELRYARDFYGYSPVVVSQFNRSISNPMRIKNGDVEPQLEDFSDSSSTQNDADVVLALFDPMRYKVADPSGYTLEKLKDQYGAKYFRSLRLIKNSYGSDDLRIGLGFLGQLGIFKELPRQKEMTESDYESVTDKSFFLNK